MLHSLFSVNANPEVAASETVLGIYGVNRTAPFKTPTAASAILALNTPPRHGGKKDSEPFYPASSNLQP
jgi:hypothetical protein